MYTTIKQDKNKPYTISGLTAGLKSLLEKNFPLVWISGEISNFSMPVSRHFYFTLKDSKAQISAVMFRGLNRRLSFMPENEMSITGMGRISVYEPRGTYQLILEYMEPEGTGALLLAFEKLKARLSEEGLFDEKHKSPIPFLPKKISVLTSPTGAVVHDIIKVVTRRFPNIHIEIIPVKVQGYFAEDEIVAGLELINSRAGGDTGADVAILARGGGAVEDLAPFNSERVARAIFACKIPLISAVGHETDFTIADFVSDLRAPTPSAAAEIIVPLRDELFKKYLNFTENLRRVSLQYHRNKYTLLNNLSKRLIDPKRKIQDSRLKTDDFTTRLIRIFSSYLQQKRKLLAWQVDILHANNPLTRIKNFNGKHAQIHNNLLTYLKINLNNKHSQLRELTTRLQSLNPSAILKRGYSITRTIPDSIVVSNSEAVCLGQKLEVLMAKGSLICRVEGKSNNG